MIIKNVLLKIIVVVNGLIFLFSAILVGGCAYQIYNFDDSLDNFLDKSDYAYFLVAGLIGMFIAVLACCGVRNPESHYNILFCYFFLLSVVLILNCGGFYVFRTFMSNVQATSGGDISEAVEEAASKEFQDFILSTYTTCCTGCLKAELSDCAADLPPNDPLNCPTAGLDVSDDCKYAVLCESNATNEGLGEGCYTTALSIPSYEILSDVCTFLVDYAKTDDDVPIVGLASSGSCGGGDPKAYVASVENWLTKDYYLIAVPWGFGIAIAFCAWLGSLIILLCPHGDKDKALV